MTNSTYRYPPDEFDVAVPGGAPVGVHRAPRSGWSSAWPFLLVALVCAGVAWGGITLLSGGGNEGDSAAEPTASVSAAPSASPSEGEGNGENGGEGGEGGNEPSEEPSAPSTADLVAAMDPAATYLVHNTGRTIDQLAATTVTNLEAEGVSGAEVSTAAAPEGVDVSGISANTIWYGEGREAEGKALAAVLGIPDSNVVMNDAVTNSQQAAWVFMFTAPA
ncbi:hypothetical protein [Myceligenerans pegani]|uniref:LytR/CpsA/Psr regulator C-terminal domain-containing protein n=1 Tax=Myceligenerans pegani TaxID=2776917 RepID=A0ABR9MUY6_9MICO|nr:hypothetical protein [Myceligenerans sp. TRM 65318]MBE1875204.1 hypothetical protein [Myceligenerans sp. TRM 65318]MBE3017475.1 hypothetical protein [Myceligenerans sp. TRM 65318]